MISRKMERTILQGLEKMIKLLERKYQETGSDNFGSMLGDLLLVDDESITADPAAWEDWQESITEALISEQAEIDDEVIFKAMINYLQSYHERTNQSKKDLGELIGELKSLKKNDGSIESL
jgi:hypothetical protein